MLVITRKSRQEIIIGDVKIVIGRISTGKVTIAIEAPPDVKILRGELKEEKRDAA